MPDRQRLLDQILDFPESITKAQDLGMSIEFDQSVEQIVVAGMGSSGVAGHLLKAILHDKPVQITVVNEFKLPAWVDKKTLVFVISHSGDTQEALDMFADAVHKKVQLVILSSGGRLLQLAREKNRSYIKLPTRILPRTSVVYTLMGMLNMIAATGLISQSRPDIYTITTVLKHPAWQKKGDDLAKKLVNKVPLIYTSSHLYGVALRMKQVLNENAKVHAFINTVPELGHNEIEGFENLQARLQVVMIQDENDPPKLRKKMSQIKKLIEEKGVEVTVIRLKGKSMLTKVLTAMHLADLASYSLSQIYDLDPSPTESISALKDN